MSSEQLYGSILHFPTSRSRDLEHILSTRPMGTGAAGRLRPGGERAVCGDQAVEGPEHWTLAKGPGCQQKAVGISEGLGRRWGVWRELI